MGDLAFGTVKYLAMQLALYTSWPAQLAAVVNLMASILGPSGSFQKA